MQPVNADQASGKQGAVSPQVDRRKNIDRTVRKLVDERQRMLIRFCQLAGITSTDEVEEVNDDSVDFQPTVAELENFCEVLMDYLGTGHFELYQRIIDGHERRQSVLRAAQQFYPAIAETTQFLVEFNDKYDPFEGSAAECHSLRSDLNKIGKAISLRSDFEDKMLSALHR